MKTPSEGLQEKRHRFFSPPEKARARDLVEWLNALADRPLPTAPCRPPLAVPSTVNARTRAAWSSSRKTRSGYFAQTTEDYRTFHECFAPSLLRPCAP
ncbi:hypothetical protein Landi51_08312 [Colletotrichum acutatum]